MVKSNLKAGVVKTAGRTLANDMSAELKKLKKALDQTIEDIHFIEKGDSDGAYWNGQLAIRTLNHCLKNYDRNVELYKQLLKIQSNIDVLVKYSTNK